MQNFVLGETPNEYQYKKQRPKLEGIIPVTSQNSALVVDGLTHDWFI